MAGPTKGIGESEDTRFQERTWIAERVAWFLLGCVIIAGLAGIFANGPLSKTTSSSPTGDYTLTYHRFMRYMAPSQILLEVPFDNTSVLRVSVDNSLWKALDIQRIYPEPARSFAGPSSIGFEFLRGGGVATVIFDVKPNTIGPVEGAFSVGGGGAIQLRHWVYP